MTAIAATMQAFFTERLIGQRRASPHTVAAYRDTLRLLLGFAAEHAGTPPCRLDIADLNAPLIGAFLDHIEHHRGNSIRTRNARLAAVRSLFAFAALRHPEHAADIARVLAIPAKRGDQALLELTRKFDRVDLAAVGLRVSVAEIEAASAAAFVEHPAPSSGPTTNAREFPL